MVLKKLVLYEVAFSCFDFFLSQIEQEQKFKKLCGMICSAGKESELRNTR